LDAKVKWGQGVLKSIPAAGVSFFAKINNNGRKQQASLSKNPNSTVRLSFFGAFYKKRNFKTAIIIDLRKAF
jgi:hypothetical protein